MAEDNSPVQWDRIHNDPALDPTAWDLDAIDVEPGTLTLHHHGGVSWKIGGFPQPQDAIAFMLTGDHTPGTKREPNEYELLTGRTLTWTRV